MMGGPGHAPPPPLTKPAPKTRSSDVRRQRKRDHARASYYHNHMWTRCPGCGNFFAWFFQKGLKGEVCACGRMFTGRERNPIFRRCTNGDGIVHKTWVNTQQKTTAYLRCEVGGAWSSLNAKPLPADTQVTCLLCLAILEDE